MNFGANTGERLKTVWIKFRERRRRKVQKRAKAKNEPPKSTNNIRIKAPEIKPAPKVPMAKQEGI